MTLKKFIAYSVASISLIISLGAQAGVNPSTPSSGAVQRRAILHYRYINNSIDLRALLGLNEAFSGYSVTSVAVDVHGSMQNTRMHLTVNGRSLYQYLTPVGRVVFQPRNVVLDENAQGLGLYIDGLSDIDAVTVTLTPAHNAPVPPGSEEVSVPMDIFRRMHGADSLNLSDYADLNQYAGFKVTAIEITGRANENIAQLDLVVNNRGDGAGSVQLSPAQQVYTLIPRDTVLSSGDALTLLNRGDINIDKITLKLSR